MLTQQQTKKLIKRLRRLIPRLHDEANIKQTSRKRIQYTSARRVL